MKPHELFLRLRRLSLLIQQGSAAGGAHFRSLVRFQGRGERAGLSEEGSYRDYHFVLSQIRGRPTFRRHEIAPRQEFTLVLDRRDLHRGRDWNRALSLTQCVCGMLVAFPESTVTFGVLGSRRPSIPITISDFHGWTRFLQRGESERRLGSEIVPDEQLLRVVSPDTQSHVVVVSQWIDPALFLSGRFPLGFTVFCCEPASWPLCPPRAGFAANPRLIGLPASRGYDAYVSALERFRGRCDGVTRRCYRIPGRGRILRRFERAMTHRWERK